MNNFIFIKYYCENTIFTFFIDMGFATLLLQEAKKRNCAIYAAQPTLQCITY